MPKIRQGRTLTPFEQKFINEYLVDPNGIRAYRRARGDKVSYRIAHVEAVKLLAKPSIRAEIDAALKAVSRYAKIKAGKVVEGLKRVALVDPLDFIDRDTGNLLPLEKIPHRARLAIKKMKSKVESRKLETFKDDNGEDAAAEVTTEIVEIEFADRVAALDKLMKHLGQYLKDNAQKSGKLTEAEAEAIKERLKMRGFDVDKVMARSAN